MNSRYSIIILLLFISSSLLAKAPADKDFRVINSTSRYLLIEYTPKFTDTSRISINSNTFVRIGLLYGFVADEIETGQPAESERNFMIGVPSEFGNTIEIVESSFKEIQGQLAPKPKAVIKDKIAQFEYQTGSSYGNLREHELIKMGEFGFARSIPVQKVKIFPVENRSGEGKIRLYTRIVFRVNFAGAAAASGPKIQLSKDDALKDAIINYEAALSFAVPEKQSRLNKGKINSVLSSGKWYRFEAPEEGIYKITQQTISSLGLNPQTIDPKTIRIFNNGGRALSETVDSKKAEDLQENAVFVQKAQDDGKFNSEDFVLFYGRGIHFWEYDTSQKAMQRYYHPYSKANYYFMTFSQGPSKRMTDKGASPQAAQIIQQTTKAYAAWEEDKAKLMNSGRQYMGDAFGDAQKSRSYLTSLSGIIAGSKVSYKVSFISRSEDNAGLRIEENSSGGNTLVADTYVLGLGYGNLDAAEGYRGLERTVLTTLTPTITDGNSLLKFTYSPISQPNWGYLNYFEISYTRQMNATGDQLVFYSPDTTAAVEYRMTGFSNSNFTVFDISDPLNVKIVGSAKISGGDCTFMAQEQAKKLSKYMAANSSVFKAPVRFEALTNSNLHGMEDEGKLIIITHRNFLEQARRLEQHKESLSEKITTVVADVQDIYNEFSGGLQDVSGIRDFIKYAYDNWTVKPEYVLLFGDGDYDYKDIDGKHVNFVIPYESYESLHNINSYASDDFYVYVSGRDLIVDLAIGRINVTSTQEAKAAVDKIIKYETTEQPGIWRNLITLVADDAYTSSGFEGSYHNVQSEELSKMIPPSFDQNKIYEIFYQTTETSFGRRKPRVNQAIIDAVNSGTLLLNWIGHGNPDVWAHEYVFEKGSTIPQLVNEKYSFLTAATCDFGRYDSPEEQSSTELMLLKSDGGIIGAFTSARTVYSSDNAALNELFYSKLLAADSLGRYKSVGKAYMLTKMEKNLLNDLKFHLFGDPTIKLLMPRMNLAIDSLNGLPSTETVSVKALSKLRVSGSVRNLDKTINPQAGGEVLLTVYDSERMVPSSELNGYLVKFQGGIIYKGLSSVSGGRFTAAFTVPKDISYEDKPGKVEAYLQTGQSDALGYTKSIIVGGSDSTAVNDKKGPEMEIALDRPDGVNSVLVSPDFTLYVRLKDETGINTTGTGIGHRLEAVLNGNENQPIDLSGEFTGDMDSGGRSGLVRHDFTGMAPGNYTVKVKVWDVFNNPGEQEKRFTVTESEGLVIRDLYNYPNPFKDRTTFSFQHNMNEAVNVMVKVYTVSGRMIRQIEASAIADRFVRVDWDGRDQDGGMVANGTYLYKMTVKSISDSYSRELIGKLAVIR